jgi:CO/xanthine dehydrogenase FAD-binding subunit
MTGLPFMIARDASDALVARRALGPAARFIAGGTALQLAWPFGRANHALVSVAAIDLGKPVSLQGDNLRLSANALLEDVRTSPQVALHAPILATAISAIGALGVRHLATIGGNLAWRAGDLVPLLLVLDASVVSFEAGSTSVAEWLQEKMDDLVLSVEIPLPLPPVAMWEKVGRRASFSPSLITVAGAIVPGISGAIDTVRLAVGGGPVPPTRLPLTEAQLIADKQNSLPAVATSLRDEVAAKIEALEDFLPTGSYRARAAANVLSYFIQEHRI